MVGSSPRPAARIQRARNDFWRAFGYHHGRLRLRNQPALLAVESTNHCNLRCVMCPRGEPDVMERSLGTMSDAVFDRVLDEVRFFEEPCWFHRFGEPLMHPPLFDQIERAKGRGVPNLGISTNGTLLDDRRRRALLASPLDDSATRDGPCPSGSGRAAEPGGDRARHPGADAVARRASRRKRALAATTATATSRTQARSMRCDHGAIASNRIRARSSTA